MTHTLYRPYAGRRVGLLVIVALVLIGIALLESSFIQDFFSPSKKLRVLLPESGVAGLARGADVDILGTPAGQVQKIVISQKQRFHAVVEIDKAMASYVRRDSVVLIKRQFGIAGAAYLDISRGKGARLNWDYAVLSAHPERGATDNLGKLITELRKRIFPVIDHANQTLTTVASLTEGLQQGKGTAGRLLTDDALFTQLKATASEARQRAAEAAGLIKNLRVSSGQLSKLGRQLNDPRSGVPAILNSVNATLDQLRSTIGQMHRLTTTAAGSSDQLPLLLSRAQVTLRDLDRLLVVLQNNWLIGGDAGPQTGKPPGANQLWR